MLTAIYMHGQEAEGQSWGFGLPGQGAARCFGVAQSHSTG